MDWKRTYIEVIARFEPGGRIMPLSIKWEGIPYEIDRVIDIKQRAALKAGGGGMRYTCRILGKDRYLFYEKQEWFVEESVRNPV